MALTRYQWNTASDLIAQIDFVSNSFGRTDATIIPADGADETKLATLTKQLEAQGIVAYPDIQDGKQVLTAYGFGTPERLTNALKLSGFISSTPQIQIEKVIGGQSDARKFIQRYSIQLAAVSGLLGHASMYSLAAKTGNKNFYLTAGGYTTADGVIAAYGTDKSVTADPVMQDFKRYLWEQGIDNRFVNADVGEISLPQSANSFMKKYGFQIANAAGASGNLGMIMGGMKGSQKDFGMVAAGATSLFGAGLQIFGTEAKVDPDQSQRKSVVANALSFVNTNPMQIAAATNIADPLLLTHSALMTNRRNRKTVVENTHKILEAQASIIGIAQQGDLNLNALPEGIRHTIETERSIVADVEAVRSKIDKIEGPRFKGWGPIGKVAGAIRDFRGPQTEELKTLYSELAKHESLLAKNSQFIGESAADLHKLLKGSNIENAAKIAGQIKEWQQEIKLAHNGGKVEPYIRGLVAAFYGGATVIRLISRKTATADENKDAFNEVYAAAAESLLNIKEPEQRESMLLQFGHYLSTHPKMKEPSEVILEKLRERVETFEQNPFVHHAAVPTKKAEPAPDAAPEHKDTPDSHVVASTQTREGTLPTKAAQAAQLT